MSRPVPKPGILDIAPYAPGKSPVPEPGRKSVDRRKRSRQVGVKPKANVTGGNAILPRRNRAA